MKVRGLIQDLIDKLQADALSEQNQKEDCDKGISKATGDRDEANARIEVARAELTVLNANREAAKVNTQQLNKQIAEIKKAVKEAVELNAENVANLEEKIAMCTEGASAVEFALTVLSEFYSKTASPSLLQSGKYTPYGADREGNTLENLVPEGTQPDRTYHGKQEESKGIIGILEVILSDFNKAMRMAEQDKKDSEDGLEMFQADSDEDIKEKKGIIQESEERITELDGHIAEQEQEDRDATSLLESATKTLEDWHATCVQGEETWEERQEKRHAEIAAIKAALTALEDWQGGKVGGTYMR